MANAKQTFDEILEIAKVLELGQLKQAGEALEAHRYEYESFLEDCAEAITNKYGYNDSLKTQIACCLQGVADNIDYASDMFEGSFDDRWAYIAKKAEKFEFVLALKAFSQMKDFDELIKGPKPLTPKQKAELSKRESKKACHVVGDKLYLDDYTFSTEEPQIEEDEEMEYLYLPKTNSVLTKSSSIKSLALSKVEDDGGLIHYDASIDMTPDKVSDELACRDALRLVKESLDEDGLSLKKTRVYLGCNDSDTNVLILKGSQLYSQEGLKGYQDYLDRKKNQSLEQINQLLYN